MTDEAAGKAGRETPLGPHPDGIGPSCKDELGCQARRRHASG